MKNKLPFFTRFTPRADRLNPVVATPPEEGRTKQEFAAECDINNIMAKYKRTGVLPDSARAAAARYGDFSGIPDFYEMSNRVTAAQEVFNALPAHVRESFGNDPGAFIRASETPAGMELLVELGLASRREPNPSSQPLSEPVSEPKTRSKKSDPVE